MPQWLSAAVVFVVGAALGSFLNVVIYRLPRGESIVTPRSRCPHCGTPIASHDNIPVLSFLLLRGRCRACGKPISPRYLVVELLTGVLLAALWVREGLGLGFAAGGVLALLLLPALFLHLGPPTLP